MLKNPEARAQLQMQGVLPRDSTSPDELGTYVKSQYALWKRITREAGLVQ